MLLLNMVSSPPAIAAELAGVVHHVAGPYLLLQTQAGSQVVRTGRDTAFGNMVGSGVLKYGGDQLQVRYDTTVAGVIIATDLARETEYVPTAEAAVSVEQLAAELGTVLLVDSRSQVEWEAGRLPGAIRFSQPDELLRSLREQGKGKRVVFYGSSAADLRPYAAARACRSNGLAQIGIFAGGVKEWRRQGKAILVSPVHLQRLLDSNSPFRIVDLREASTSRIPIVTGAEPIPAAAMSRESVFLGDRSFQLPLFLYGEEKDLQAAVSRLAGWGYHQDGDFALLDQSWPEWAGKLRVSAYLPGKLPPDEVGYDEFRLIWSAPGPDRLLLNVKPKRDRVLPAELHIPLEELPERIAELPRDKEIIIYCSVGLRSAIAQQILRQNGISSRFLNRVLRLDGSGNPGAD